MAAGGSLLRRASEYSILVDELRPDLSDHGLGRFLAGYFFLLEGRRSVAASGPPAYIAASGTAANGTVASPRTHRPRRPACQRVEICCRRAL
jgi:hypothetical protein